MIENRERPDDQISLPEFWSVLSHYKGWVLGLPVLAVAAALVLVFLVLKPEWEAVALVQIGQIGQLGRGSALIEPVPRVVARVSSGGFQRAVLASIGTSNSENNQEAALYRRSIKVTAPANTIDLVQVKVRGYSPQQADRLIAATVAYLRKVHEKLAASSILRLKQQLAKLDAQIAEIQAERAGMLKKFDAKKIGTPAERFMEGIVLDNIVVQLDATLRGLDRTRMAYDEQLSPERTYPTSLVENVYVSPKPVFPKKALTVTLAGVLALFVGVFMAFVINSFHVRTGGE